MNAYRFSTLAKESRMLELKKLTARLAQCPMRQGMGHSIFVAGGILNGARIELSHKFNSPSIEGDELPALVSALKLSDDELEVQPDVQLLRSQPHRLL